MSRGNVTLEQIALEAGVSTQTVANALNRTNKENWGSTARRASHIRDVAARLGYQPNGAAKAVRTGRFGAVALLLSTNVNASDLPQLLWQGIFDDQIEHDNHLTLFRLPDDAMTDPVTLPKILRERIAEGMIIDYTYSIPPQLVEIIEANDLPAVWLNTNRDTDSVRPDDLAGSRLATKTLIDLGHRRIAYIDLYVLGSHKEMHYSAHERLDGYEVEMAGLAKRIVLYEGDRKDRIRELLTGPNPPTAVLCYGSLDAEVVMYVAHGLGINIPGDLSVLTFGPRRCRVADTDVAHVVVPEYEVGRRASEMLRRKIEDPGVKLPAERLNCYMEKEKTLRPISEGTTRG